MHGIRNTFNTIHKKVGQRCFNALLVITNGSSNEVLDIIILLLAFLGILYVTFNNKKPPCEPITYTIILPLLACAT
jgi:hypothetical protein